MADPKWTPGPWRWVKEKPAAGSKPLAKLVGAGGTEVCNFGNAYDYYPSAGVEPNEYDKNLIAAAPDLYKACEAALGQLQYLQLMTWRRDSVKTIELLEAALRKARGESNE